MAWKQFYWESIRHYDTEAEANEAINSTRLINSVRRMENKVKKIPSPLFKYRKLKLENGKYQVKEWMGPF